MATISFKAFDGTPFKFTDTAQLLEFVNQEIGWWSWLSQMTGNNPAQQIYQLIVTPLSSVQGYLQQPVTTPEVLEALRGQFQSYLNVNPPVHPKAPLRHVLDKRIKSDPYSALFLLATVGQQIGAWPRFGDNIGGQSSFAAGVALGTAFVEGWRENEKATAVTASAALSAQEAAAALTAARESEAVASSIATALQKLEVEERENITKLTATLRAENDVLREELRLAIDTATERLNTEWKSLTATYDAQLALKAPANYWSTKKRSHTKWVAGLCVATLCAAGGGAYGLYRLAEVVFGGLALGTLPTWLQVISFSLGAVVYLWTLRSFLRFLLSHAHLALDAAERQTMIVSYLALVRKQGVKAEAMEQVFTSIFRPSGDGIVKDEGIPLPSLLEMLMKR